MASPARDETGLARLAYEISLRALTQQEGVLDELRGRTGTLLAASSLVASFLGARAIDGGGVPALTALALAAFAVSVLASLYVLLPKPNLVFALRGSVLFEEELADPGGLSETFRRLAYWLEEYRDANEPTIERMFQLYRVAIVAVLAQVIVWSIALGVD